MGRFGVWLLVCLLGVLGAHDVTVAQERSAVGARAAVVVVPALSQAAWLRSRLPADTIFYLRVPSPIGMLRAPSGRALDGAGSQPAVVELVERIRYGFANEPLLADGYAAIGRLLFSHWAGPAELAMVAPNRIPGPGSSVIASLPLSGIADADAFASLLSAIDGPRVELDDAGYALAGDTALRFDVRSGRLLVLGGVGATVERLKEVEATLVPAEPPFAADEARIDTSGQGAYLWLDLMAVRALAAMGASGDPGLAMLAQVATHGRALGMGLGTTGGKGRAALHLAAPKAPFLDYLPAETRRFDVRTAAQPRYALALSLLYAPDEYARFKQRLLADFGEAAHARLLELEELMRTGIGFSVEDLLASVGPDFGAFGDAAGDFSFVKVRDRRRLEAMLQVVGEHPGVVRTQQRGIHMLDLPGMKSPGHPFPAMEMFDRVHTRLFWIEEGDYLVFANTPQALMDRQAAAPKARLRDFLAKAVGADYEQSLLMFAGRGEQMARTTYEYGLMILHSLADTANVRFDPFAFAPSSKLNLPAEGTVSLVLANSQDGLLLGLQYDNGPFDFLGGTTSLMVGVAVVGIVAAIALPAYQDYTARSQVSEAIAAAGALKVAVQEYTVERGALPESLELFGVDADDLNSRYATYSLEDGQLIVQMREDAVVNTAVRGKRVALALRKGDAPDWVCGLAAAGEAGEDFHGGNPAALTTLSAKHLPSICQ